MIKKLAILGVVLIILAFVVGGIGASLTNPLSVFVQKNITLTAGNYSYINIAVPAKADFLLEAKAASPVNFYVLNSSAFAQWSSPAANASPGIGSAVSLESAGAFVIESNVTAITFPASPNSTASYVAPEYEMLNFSHNYYFVFQNPAAISDNVTVVYLPPVTNTTLRTDSKLRNLIYSYGAIIVSVILILAAGVIVLIYGIIKKPKQPLLDQAMGKGGKNEPDKAYIDTLYKNVEKSQRKAKKKSDNS